MNRPGIIRWLRIAWSAAWGLLSVLLCVLWVRSYWWVEMYVGPSLFGVSFVGGSMPGTLAIGSTTTSVRFPANNYLRTDADEWWSLVNENAVPPYNSRIWGTFLQQNGSVAAPYWFAFTLSCLATALPWLRFGWQFSLRTLLIATTLVAVVLGLIVWGVRG